MKCLFPATPAGVNSLSSMSTDSSPCCRLVSVLQAEWTLFRKAWRQRSYTAIFTPWRQDWPVFALQQSIHPKELRDVLQKALTRCFCPQLLSSPAGGFRTAHELLALHRKMVPSRKLHIASIIITLWQYLVVFGKTVLVDCRELVIVGFRSNTHKPCLRLWIKLAALRWHFTF